MKNELGIEVKCENCDVNVQRDCSNWNYAPAGCNKCLREFLPSSKSYEARIRELRGMVMQAAMAAEKVPHLERRVKELTEENKKLKGEI